MTQKTHQHKRIWATLGFTCFLVSMLPGNLQAQYLPLPVIYAFGCNSSGCVQPNSAQIEPAVKISSNYLENKDSVHYREQECDVDLAGITLDVPVQCDGFSIAVLERSDPQPYNGYGAAEQGYWTEYQVTLQVTVDEQQKAEVTKQILRFSFNSPPRYDSKSVTD